MQRPFCSNEPHLQRQDIKVVVDNLYKITEQVVRECDVMYYVSEAITILEDLGNLVHRLEEENASLKQELKDINKAIDDPAADLTMTASECILKLKKENIKLKQEILQLEAIIDD